ncbi:hypothetical protein EIP91_001671 [Steccherinum ochraceum]|uniref:Uncharacterized protein n=1 Tax=Steccherinum ochraceum TaxID=92696 RepID=A0A4R0RQS6_9APHY|nr:hypothetical protein EIP91_001671 [Steccherinum ochraceum]
MGSVIPSIEQVEDYLQSVEELFFASLSAATPDLPNVRQAIQRLWEDVLRHGPQALPSLPDLHIPGLGAFEVPPPPPPPPPPKSLLDKTADWVGDHKWTTAALGVSLVGVGLLAGYSTLQYQQQLKSRRNVRASSSTERRQIVGQCITTPNVLACVMLTIPQVVLGGDSPLGLPLILDLEKQGYIVIASVSSSEAADEVESQCHGYVRALVLDPNEPETVPYFLRSLSSTMSRRFPITAAGDPHASPSSYPYIHSIVSLLTLPSHSSTPTPAPLEHLSLREDYATFLQTSHIIPLQVIQALLPLLRNSSARARDSLSNSLGRKSIVVCLPATDTRVGLPFMSAQGMSAAATLRAVEILRREIRIAGFNASSDSMKNIKVTVVDVGAVGPRPADEDFSMFDIESSIDDWTPSERAAYGPAFTSLGMRLGGVRRPSDTSAFVKTVVDVVHDGSRYSRESVLEIGLSVVARVREWIRGDRVVVGSGAGTYALASYLPAILLDGLLSLPHFLISIRNALLPIQPHVMPAQEKAPTTVAAPVPRPAQQRLRIEDSPVSSDQETHEIISDTGSEADVESNGSGVGESWVSLKEGEHSPERS